MKKVLVVEDNDSSCLLLTFILRSHYEFARAKNGQEAVDMAQAGGFDLILMDLKMPVMDGLEATRKIKAVFPNLPIIALTANAFDNDREHAFEAGCDDFLSKPVSSEKCLEVIAKFI